MSIFLTLESSKPLCTIAQQFLLDDMSPDDIGNASIRFFELLHLPGSSLQQIRKQKYHIMVASDRANNNPALLPPSPRAAYYHGLRVYHQIKVWRNLSDSDIDLLD